jgi:uncharacterized protein
MRSRLAIIWAFCFVLGCGNSATDQTQNELPTTTMTIGGQQFVMEKAVTEFQQHMGLMRRDSLAADHGMIFPFQFAAPQTFWNHDVRFPLDVLFLDDDGNIVSIQHMNAYDDTNTQTVTARYVVELNSGTAQRLGLKTGDHLNVPADVRGQ